MAYLQVRVRKTKSGDKWTICQATWQKKIKEYRERKIPATAFVDLGFSEHMTVEQAREHAKHLNKRAADERRLHGAKVSAAENLHYNTLVKNSIVTEEMNALFEDHIRTSFYGNAYNLKKRFQHWVLIQEIISELKLYPHEFHKRRVSIYRAFEHRRFSKSYIQKLLKVLNLWGEFFSDQKQTFFKKVPNPTGIVLQAIASASTATGEGADPLTVDSLSSLRAGLVDEQWRYMRATLWLGLRPSELNLILNDPTKMKIEMQNGTPILTVYQPKLNSQVENKRWKSIPCFHPEMVAALDDIKSKSPKKPLVKTLRRLAPKMPNIGLYSGRKGFTDLMLSYGQTLENVSAWLGHASIERTWQHYKNKKNIVFKGIGSPQKTG